MLVDKRFDTGDVLGGNRPAAVAYRNVHTAIMAEIATERKVPHAKCSPNYCRYRPGSAALTRSAATSPPPAPKTDRRSRSEAAARAPPSGTPPRLHARATTRTARRKVVSETTGIPARRRSTA